MRQELMTTREVLDRLRIGRATLYRLMDAGNFPKPLKMMRNNRWRTADVDAWLEAEVERAAA